MRVDLICGRQKAAVQHKQRTFYCATRSYDGQVSLYSACLYAEIVC